MSNTVAVPSCRSVFREGTAGLTKETYTQIWAALINQLERSKQVLAGAR